MTFSPSVDFVPAQPPREPGYVDEIRGALKEIEENLDENKKEQKELRKVRCVIVIIISMATQWLSNKKLYSIIKFLLLESQSRILHYVSSFFF